MEYSHPVDQANILNKQFKSAFSTKDTYSPDVFNTRCKISGQYPSADERGATPLLSDLLCLMYIQKRFMLLCWFSSSPLGVTMFSIYFQYSLKQFKSAFSTKDTYSPDVFNTRCKISGQYPSADELDITENGLLKLLTSINPNKAAGPDNIKPKLLKELATETAPILTILFWKSFDTGEVPSDWRNANVSQVFKKGKKYKAENYRPISLACICCMLVSNFRTPFSVISSSSAEGY
jgi:hypothetical protein